VEKEKKPEVGESVMINTSDDKSLVTAEDV